MSWKDITKVLMGAIGGLAGVGALISAWTGNWEMFQAFVEILNTTL
jgi:hypothetical protein